MKIMANKISGSKKKYIRKHALIPPAHILSTNYYYNLSFAFIHSTKMQEDFEGTGGLTAVLWTLGHAPGRKSDMLSTTLS